MATSQPETHQEKSKVIWVIGALIIIILAIYIWYTSGSTGLWAFFKQMIIYLLIVMVVGLIIFGVLKLLQRPRVDLVANDRQDIIDAALLSKPPMIKDLYFAGDKDHGEFRVGSIIGYCQLQSYKDLDILAGLTKPQLEEMQENKEIPSQYIVKEDVFVFKRFFFPFSIFEAPKVLRTFEDEHSQLIGDVKVYGVSMIKKYDYYWPNRGHLDIARIDISVIREAWRGAVHQFLRDMVSINQKASGLDSEHKKNLEQRKLLKIPSPLGEEENRR